MQNFITVTQVSRASQGSRCCTPLHLNAFQCSDAIKQDFQTPFPLKKEGQFRASKVQQLICLCLIAAPVQDLAPTHNPAAPPAATPVAATPSAPRSWADMLKDRSAAPAPASRPPSKPPQKIEVPSKRASSAVLTAPRQAPPPAQVNTTLPAKRAPSPATLGPIPLSAGPQPVKAGQAFCKQCTKQLLLL